MTTRKSDQTIGDGLPTGDSDLWHFRAVAAYQRNQLEDAIEYWGKAIEQDPRPHYRHNLATALCDLAASQAERGELEPAFVVLTEAANLAPQLFQAQAALGIVATELQHWEIASRALNSALALQETNARVHDALGVLAGRQSRWAEAIRHHSNAIQQDARGVDAWNNLGHALLQIGASDKAITALEQALTLKDDFAEAHNNLGNAYRDCGRFEAAKRHYLKALELKPILTEAQFNLAELHRYRPDDAELTRLLQTPLPAHAAGAALLLFARGKALDDLDRTDEAFASWQQANRLIREHNGYDEAQTLQRLERLCLQIQSLAPQAPASSAENASLNHVFIVGAPRCGSTLLEQILISHPVIYGVGERDFFEQALLTESRNVSDGADIEPAYSAEQLQRIAHRYRNAIASTLEKGIGTSLVVDKFLANSLHLGCIHQALPAAKIVVLARDPRDLAWSCFTKRFSSGHPYAYDLAELGRYLSAHDRLLEAVCRHLPATTVMRIQYEDLIEHPEAVIRRLLHFLGVAWHPGCLEFHSADRIVTTASAQQVRKPINRDGIGRWRRYERHLGPLLSAL